MLCALFIAASTLLTMSSCTFTFSVGKKVNKNASTNYDVKNPTFATQLGGDIYYCCRTADGEFSIVKKNKESGLLTTITKYKSDGYTNTIFAVNDDTLCYSTHTNPETEDDYSQYVYYLYNIKTKKTTELLDPKYFAGGVKSVSYVSRKIYFLYRNYNYLTEGDVDFYYDLFSCDSKGKTENLAYEPSDYTVYDNDIYYFRDNRVILRNPVKGKKDTVAFDMPVETSHFRLYKNMMFYEGIDTLGIYNIETDKTFSISGVNKTGKTDYYDVDSLLFDKNYFYCYSNGESLLARISYDGKDMKRLKSGKISMLGEVDGRLYFYCGEGKTCKLMSMKKDGTDETELVAPKS